MTTPQEALSDLSWPVVPGAGPDEFLQRSLRILRSKWGEVPAGGRRVFSQDMLALSDTELLRTWQLCRRDTSAGKGFHNRGWRHQLYKDAFRGRKIMDVGCGLAFDTITYGEHGAIVTFVDLVESNVQLVSRLCRIMQISGQSFCYMEDLRSLKRLPDDFDVIYCCGSLINAPMDVIRIEAQEVLKHLPVGGRWIELAYPQSRWEREGMMPFDRWGEKTDGGAPWMEWHDLTKIRHYLAPAEFEVVLAFDFHNGDFNWFDLVRTA